MNYIFSCRLTKSICFFSKYWSFKQYFISFLSTLCLLFDNKDTFPSTVWVPYGLLLKVLRLQVTKMECRIYLHIFEVFLKLATYLLHISWNSATCLLHICCTKVHVVVLHSLTTLCSRQMSVKSSQAGWMARRSVSAN